MSLILEDPPKRKILRLKHDPQTAEEKKADAPHFVIQAHSFYMVWKEGGDMPQRLYRADERHTAVCHAKALAAKTGERFHVMRSWRAFEPKP